MRHLMLSAIALLGVLAFSNFGTTSATASNLSHKPRLKNHHVKAPGYHRQRARHHSRHRKFSRKQKYVRHQRRSVRKSFRSRYRSVGTSGGYVRQHRHTRHHQHASRKYRNRTQFCRRNWELHHGREVVVRRCVWVHNSKLRGAKTPRIEGH